MPGPASGPEPAFLDLLYRRRRQDLRLTSPDRIPEILIDDPQMGDFLDDPFLRWIGACEPLAGFGILDVALPVPDEAANIELVVDETGPPGPVAADRGIAPRAAMRPGNVLVVEIPRDRPRRAARRELP